MDNKHSFISPAIYSPWSILSYRFDVLQEGSVGWDTQLSPLFRALEVPGSHKQGLERNRKNSYSGMSRASTAKKWQRKRLDFDCVCFFLFVKFAPQSHHWRAVSFCVLSCRPGRKTETKRKGKKRAWCWKHLDFLMCLTSWECLFLFVQ